MPPGELSAKVLTGEEGDAAALGQALDESRTGDMPSSPSLAVLTETLVTGQQQHVPHGVLLFFGR